MSARVVFVLLTAAVAALALSLLIGHSVGPIMHRSRVEPFLRAARLRGQVPFSSFSVALATYYALPMTGLSSEVLRHLRHWDQLVMIGTAGWLLAKLLHLSEEWIFRRNPRVPTDEEARRTRTQVRMLRRTTVALVVLITLGIMLLTFRQVRVIGVSMLASAGVFGLVIGAAARPALSAAMASVQMAFTGSLHLDDVVVVDGQWGQVEEVELTHVVIRTWDERQLVLPTTYLIERPYENWTRFGARVVGGVDLILDYSADLEVVRGHVASLLDRSAGWDRGPWGLQMTDMNKEFMTVRVTAAARDGPSAWNLRCDLREAVVSFLRDRHPEWLPRRAHFEP